jgi:hypothetical protein
MSMFIINAQVEHYQFKFHTRRTQTTCDNTHEQHAHQTRGANARTNNGYMQTTRY